MSNQLSVEQKKLINYLVHYYDENKKKMDKNNDKHSRKTFTLPFAAAFSMSGAKDNSIAVEKLLNLLGRDVQGHELSQQKEVVFLESDIKALTSGELGKNILKFQKEGARLPDAFLKAEKEWESPMVIRPRFE